MSQWNNTYNYSGQQQASSAWDGDVNRQYMNQGYYQNGQYDSNNQYVSFNEFISQIQGPNLPTTIAASYNNVQYQNYPSNHYTNVANYQSGPSRQSAQLVYGYQNNTANFSNNLDVYQDSTQSQYNQVPEPNGYSSEIVSKSTLTPTASEFIPKNANKNSNSIVNDDKVDAQTSLPSNTKGNRKESNWQPTPSSSSSTNWRERPQSSNENGHSSTETNTQVQKNYRFQKNNDYNSKYDENGKYAQQNNFRKDLSNNYNDHNNRNNKNKRTNDNNPSSESSYCNEYGNTRSSNNYRNKNRNNDLHRNQDSNYYGEGNDHNESGNAKNNSKLKNKQDSQSGWTFYNSTIPKSSQDVRAGRNDNNSSRGRTWAGSQRVRSSEYSNVEDEEFANSYIQYREDKDNKSPVKGKGKSTAGFADGKELTQRERLSEQLDKGTLECLVCCERVKQIDPVWYCGNCYHVLHLRCIRKWVMSSMVEGKWRCPACQNTSQDVPTEYRCMCGALRNPEYQRGSSGAHTCGKSCKRPRNCPHPCTLLCHPGPCPPCQATISKQCGCGAETRSVLCSSKLPQVCGRECQRKLACNVHICGKECHEGPCDACKETVTQVCYCPAAESRSVPCTAESGAQRSWSCGAQCGRVLSCGAHVCRSLCHAPPCTPCPLRPENVPTCPCGNTRLSPNQRKSCSDPIPLCDNICAKPLPCGPDGDKHFCKEKCHDGACRVCPDKTVLQCRCGHSSREVPCAELPEMYNNVLCQRKCNKKMSCGRHRCRATCCDVATHRCALVCSRSLACQQHRCEEFCHTGHCAPCSVVSWEELRCACGAEAVLPPVRCGTRPPACTRPCRRARSCGHAPHHSCHAAACPPCVVLTTKTCYGGHEERKTIPCSQDEFSCGMPCGKPLPCGKHTCIKTCHKGSCDAGKCTQPCREKRPACGHECAAPCHSSGGGACPSGVPCRRPVRATCACGRRTADRACTDNARDYAKLMSTLAASKMQEGGSVDLSDVQRPGNMLKTLECDEECYVEARSRRMALALQIRNPDVSAKLAPRYSDIVRAAASREPAFAQLVHDKLTELVQLAKKSKQKTRAHSFPSMNRQKRQFIHEMCEHFGCESVAYDAEPNRNVVATADREKSWLPAMSVLEVLAREAGRRKVPGPVLRAPPAPPAPTPAQPASAPAQRSGTGWATLTSTNAWAARSQPKQENQPKQETKIDYFDIPPDN